MTFSVFVICVDGLAHIVYRLCIYAVFVDNNMFVDNNGFIHIVCTVSMNTAVDGLTLIVCTVSVYAVLEDGLTFCAVLSYYVYTYIIN